MSSTGCGGKVLRDRVHALGRPIVPRLSTAVGRWRQRMGRLAASDNVTGSSRWDGGGAVDFEAYVAARGTALLSFAYVLTGDAQLAEDLTQTALGQAYRHWSRVERAEHPDASVR